MRSTRTLALVGQTIVLTGRSYTVLGIGRLDFVDSSAPSQQMLGFLPRTSPTRPAWQIKSARFWLLGRLRPGATAAQARAELETIGRSLATLTRRSTARDTLTLVSEDERMRSALFQLSY